MGECAARNFPTIPDCISKQEVEPFFFTFIYNTLPLRKQFLFEMHNIKQNAYWVYMVAVVYKDDIFKVRLKTIVGVQCIIPVFCYDKVRFIIVK